MESKAERPEAAFCLDVFLMCREFRLTMSQLMYRWVLRGLPTAHADVWRRAERVMREVVAPAVRHADVVRTARDYYASKQGGSGGVDVWLVIFAPEWAEPTLLAAVEPLPTWCRRIDWVRSRDDDLLKRRCRNYRRGLRMVTDVALDLHCSTQLQAHQCFLIDQMFAASDPRPALRAYLSTHSATHAPMDARTQDKFWRDFFSAGPSPVLSYYGHWLWNIVVGPHPPPPGTTPAVIAAALAIQCP